MSKITKISEHEFALAVVQGAVLSGSDEENIERALDIYQKAFERCAEFNKNKTQPYRTSHHNPGI